ncbi:MAG: type II toxin-antitoxin system PemK/MazF family toxin [Nanoarchaeota archaeon]
MEQFVKGDVVVLPFPFSDLSASKKRPALVITNLHGDDLILVQITSKEKFDGYSVSLNDKDFKQGKLNMSSNIRPNRLFTAEKSIINYKIGSLKEDKMNDAINKLIEIIKK